MQWLGPCSKAPRRKDCDLVRNTTAQDLLASGQVHLCTAMLTSPTPNHDTQSAGMYGCSENTAVYPDSGPGELSFKDTHQRSSEKYFLSMPRVSTVATAKFAQYESQAMFSYPYGDCSDHVGMLRTGDANFFHSTQNRRIPPEECSKQLSPPARVGSFAPAAAPSYRQSVNANPIAGLSEMTEKANFSSELDGYGATESGFCSREAAPSINGPSGGIVRTDATNWRQTDHGRELIDSRQPPFQGPFLAWVEGDQSPPHVHRYPDDSLSAARSTFYSSKVQKRPGWASESAERDRQGLQPSWPESYPVSKAHQDGSRAFANYRRWSRQGAAITPNVTVVPDPKSKFSPIFASGRTKSEQILKEHLSTFGRFLSPEPEKDEAEEKKPTKLSERAGKPWETDSKAGEKKTSSSDSSRKNSNASEEENSTAFACKWLGCDVVYSDQDDLVRHIEKAHIDQRKAEDLYICYWEGCTRQTKPFNARYKLVIHMRVHSGEKPNKCTVSRTFVRVCLFLLIVFDISYRADAEKQVLKHTMIRAMCFFASCMPTSI